MIVYIIKHEGVFPGQKFCVWNKRGNCLEFGSRKAAEIFIQIHPEAIRGEYEICTKHYSEDDVMEYGTKTNIWEGLPDPGEEKKIDPKPKKDKQIPGQMSLEDFI